VGSSPVFKFCAPGLIFGGTIGTGCSFHVLRSRTRFGWYRRCQVPFSRFALTCSFSTVPWASGPVLMFCAPGLILGGTEGAESFFLVLHSCSRFRRYRWHWVPFSCFALPDSFWAVPWASGQVFMFCAPVLIFDNTVRIGSRFHVLRSQTRFGGTAGVRSLFLLCAHVLMFDVTMSAGSRFHVLLS
jgi:hypothetical protein